MPNNKGEIEHVIEPDALEKALVAYWTSFAPTADEMRTGIVTGLNFAVYLKAAGFSDISIKRLTKIPHEDLQYIWARDGCTELLAKLQSQAIAAGPADKFRKLVNVAIDRIESVMMNANKDSDVLRAAELILDRALGKVGQMVEIKADSPLRKLLEKMSETNDIPSSGTKSQDEPLDLVLDEPSGIHVAPEST